MSLGTSIEQLRFSGHDTFHCREQWILKGLQLVENQGGADIFKENSAIPRLGVGKNMVRSIHHWLRSFSLLNNQNDITELANLLFLKENLDPYLENEGSLWLLQYYLCHSKYASIFQFIFADFFSDKATLEFSESQIFNHVNRALKIREHKAVTEKTFNSDYKVFIRTYVSPIKNEKTVEDDFSAPLITLGLVADTGRRNELNQQVYRINRSRHSVPAEIFIHCLLTEFQSEAAVNFDEIRKTVGAYFCLSNDGLEKLIEDMCDRTNKIVYKDDAGVRQLQIKAQSNLRTEILREYYGN